MTEPAHRHLKSRTEQSVLVLELTEPELRGDDLSQAVQQELLDATQREGALKVVVDMARVKLITGRGIPVLLALRHHLRQRGGQMLLCNLSPLVADVLFVTHLAAPNASPLFPFGLATDVPAAVAALSCPSG